MDYEKRMDQYPGPGSPVVHPSMQSNGFVGYENSGGVSKKEYLKSEINTIAERLARAREVKGMLCINSRKTNTGTWKTPPLDQALRNMAGQKGGETAMRFYMKFPIYRPRGHGHPDVDDDIQKIWDDQLNERAGHKFYTTDEYKKVKQPGPFDEPAASKLFFHTQEGFRPNMTTTRRSNSLCQDL